MKTKQRFNWTKCLILYEAQIKNTNRERQSFMDEFLIKFSYKYRPKGEWIISRNKVGDFMILIRLLYQTDFFLPRDSKYLEIDGYSHSYKYWRQGRRQQDNEQSDPDSIFNGIERPILQDALFLIQITGENPRKIRSLDISTFFSQQLIREDKRTFPGTDNLQFQQEGSQDLGQLLTTLKNQRITDIPVQMKNLDISTFFSQQLMKEDKRAFPDTDNQQFQQKGSEDLGQSSQESYQASDSQSHLKKYYLFEAEIPLEDLIVEQN